MAWNDWLARWRAAQQQVQGAAGGSDISGSLASLTPQTQQLQWLPQSDPQYRSDAYTTQTGMDWKQMQARMLAAQGNDVAREDSTVRAAATGGPISSQAISSLQTGSNTPSATGGADVGTNNPSDDARYDIRPGQFYSDYPQATIGKLAGDPASAAREWAKFTGTGGSAFARYMSGVFSDPMAILRTMGADPGKLDALGPDRLDQFKMLWDRMSGNRAGAGGNNLYVDPRNMLRNITNAQYSDTGKATSLGGMLANPNLLPEEQVQNTVGLILSSLQGFVSDEALNAYSATLNEFAQDWLSERNKNPDTWDKVPFVTALRQKFGNYGGLL